MLEHTLPSDSAHATLIGRAWVPTLGGPSPVVVRGGIVYDISRSFATVRDLLECPEPVEAVARAVGEDLGTIRALLANTPRAGRDASAPWLLAPIDLQPIKAAGVTFAVSMIERVIEERAGGDPERAEQIRARIGERIGGDLADVKPGSERAAALKQAFQDEGLWSQYLEVGIGPDAEIFTKAQMLSAVGTGVPVGIRASSQWNNPEPEVALVMDSRGTAKGATLANDVNLRDIEGRSALLLGAAKDNNASCAIGPFIRVFDEHFSLDSVQALTVELDVRGEDGFTLTARSDMSLISRAPQELIDQLFSAHHQYPDGAVLLLGTMFAPTADRYAPGAGFTHAIGDIVRISAPGLGGLVNVVDTSERCEPWTFGVADLMRNLANRGLLGSARPETKEVA
ncbi:MULTISPECIES: fumarylacetoacetate hydrolase family protein [Microbacterium]|uniref:fumarylacetoacetate hydrolase family protein n=1 Tax=Microbacterium TaxID=33882 RepID=UPI001B7CDF37|nr:MULTISPECIES: fumarylacetoacetate hydrolase family protein [Microbacterium]